MIFKKQAQIAITKAVLSNSYLNYISSLYLNKNTSLQ